MRNNTVGRIIVKVDRFQRTKNFVLVVLAFTALSFGWMLFSFTYLK